MFTLPHFHVANGSPCRRAAIMLLAAAGAMTPAPGQITFTPLPPRSVPFQDPHALAIGNTAGLAGREMVSVWGFPFAPSGANTWTPPGVPSPCMPFAPIPAPFALLGGCGAPRPVPPFTTAWDVAVAQFVAGGLEETCVLVVDPFTPHVETSWLPCPIFFPPGASPSQLLATDFTQDGLADLLSLDSGTGAVYLSASPAFLAFVPLAAPAPPAGHNPMRFAVGSFNNDNYPDVVITWAGPTPQATVLTNIIGVRFAPFPVVVFVPVPAPGFLGCLTVGDFGSLTAGIADVADGVDDFVVLNGSLFPAGGTNTGWVALSNRAALPAIALPVAAAPIGACGALLSHPTAVTCGDYDCDGDIDLAYASTDGRLYVRPNAGNGTFPNARPHTEVPFLHLGAAISDMETDDYDLDGDVDIAMCDWSPGGAVTMWCNTLPPGKCVHFFRGGTADLGFGPECACPRAALNTAPCLGPSINFDVVPVGQNCKHTFEGLPRRIRSAKLTIRWTPPLGGDWLALDLDAVPCKFALNYVETMTIGGTVTLDLARLPGGQNLLPRLEVTRMLDVAAGSASLVDSMDLDIVSYCEDAPDVLPDIVYTHTSLPTFGPVTFTVNAPPVYANGTGVIVFGAGVGCMDFPIPFQGVCLEPTYWVTLAANLNALGDATFTVNVPTVACCLDVHSQAFAIPLGPFVNIGSSNTISDYTK